MTKRLHICPAQGIGFEAMNNHLSIRSLGSHPSVQNIESRSEAHLQDVDGTVRATCESFVQPHRPKHVLRFRPRSVDAVIKHIQLRVVEGVASVFGLA